MDRYAFRIAFLIWLSILSTSNAAVVYVDGNATGDGSGTDWANACTTITAGLAVAATGDDVWVKSGVYPEAIALATGIGLYGGFPADGSPTFNQRDWDAHATIIDASGFETSAVLAQEIYDSTLDGFVITGGKSYFGGGLYSSGSSLTVIHSTIVDNVAVEGGGICCRATSELRLIDCSIVENLADPQGKHGGTVIVPGVTLVPAYGGGISCGSNSSLTLTDSTVSRNRCTGERTIGGGICFSGSAMIATGCTVEGNSVEGRVIDLWGRAAIKGGGVYCGGGSFPEFKNCTIAWNRAAGQDDYNGLGGGIYCAADASPHLANCIIAMNRVSGFGAYGAGIYCEEYSSPTLVNCTIAGNSSAGEYAGHGGALCCELYSTPALVNCILRNNAAEEVYNFGFDPAISITWSNVAGGYNGEGNIDADPAFMYPEGGDYHLTAGSACIDAGNNEASSGITFDLDGRSRIIDGDETGGAVVDMGPFEFDPADPPATPAATVTPTMTPTPTATDTPTPTVSVDLIYVDRNATGLNNGTSWENAFTTISEGLEAAAWGTEAWVKSATYVENITLKGGVKVYGGFPAAGSPTFEDRDWAIHESVIEAATNLPLVDCGEAATIDGFILTGPVIQCKDVSATIANCTISGGGWRGGIYCQYSSPSVTNCVIEGNSGPGISCEFASPVISNCIIRDNTAEFRGYYGSALHCLWSSPTLSDCTITGNRARPGATLYLFESSVILSDCTIEQNVGPGILSSNGYSQTLLSRCTIAGNEGWGAGFDNWPLIYDGFPSWGESEVTVSQCVIADNRGKGLGFGGQCHPSVINCTIVGNEGGISSGIHAPGTVVNSILWNQGEEFMYGEEGSLTVSSSCVQGGREGEGNFDAYPRFEDYFGGDYRLRNGSPCIDAGTDVGLPYNGVAPDVGAYEMPGWYTPGDRDHIPRIVHVAADAAPGGDGSTWEKAYVSLREAFLSSGSGDEVWVKSATYCEAVVPEPSMGLYGGFEGTETARALADWKANPTVIDATGMDTPAVLIFGDCLINGFTITGASSERGGGISVQYGSPTISNCVIARNTSGGSGGGIYGEYSTSPIIRDCTITENSSAYDGGGVDLSGTGVSLSNCVITKNSARSGGGIDLSYAEVNITNCLISLNTAEGGGSEPASGGGVRCYASSPRMTNCTIAGNSAEIGGGFICEYGATPVLTNCILWNNSPSEMVVDDSTPTVCWSNVGGGFEGEGNIDADPLFVDPAEGNYRLTAGSPCIDAGSNEAAAGILIDLDGNVRIWDGDNIPGAVVDMGAYEFGSEPPPVPGDTDGNGIVNAYDLFYFSLWWQAAENEANGLCDCVDDGTITEADLLRLIPHW